MNVNSINQGLAAGATDPAEFLPHLQDVGRSPYRFTPRFGLSELPVESGIISVRGPRQYGKSTWLEEQIAATHNTFGAGSTFYLNGDEVGTAAELAEAIRALLPLYRVDATVRRLFIDEITAVSDWQRAVKTLADAGVLRDILLVTTGSKAVDLRRGVERLPGRKGTLDRTQYVFTPLSYREFKRVCGKRLGGAVLHAYLLTGGSPVACARIAEGRLPEYVLEIVRDWIYGECAAAGRHRSAMLAVLECLVRFGGSAVGQAKVAREAGLANNTVAAGYLELLTDLMCMTPAYAWDSSHRVKLRRKPCKFPFCNTLAALAWSPAGVRTVEQFDALAPALQGTWYEWTVAQELWRRAAIDGEPIPEERAFWQSKEHELDFVLAPEHFLEVKRGSASPLEFAWFNKVFPTARLTVICQTPFETRQIVATTLEQFLSERE